jgi:hypothetical protein
VTPDDLPEGTKLDAHESQDPAHPDVWWVVLPDGTRTAINKSPLLCPTCENDRHKRVDCETCSGRGKLFSVPFCDRPWDEVVPGLWLGGHDCQFTGSPQGDCHPGDHFDMVVSLHHREGAEWQPTNDAVHLRYSMADADLDPDHHTRLDELASHVEGAVRNGDKVLVRCRAGINRSALVVGLALLKMGWTTGEAVARMRAVRSPYVLFNESFVQYLEEVEAR